MQTLAVQIDDSYMEQFMHFVNNSHAHVTIANDKNLELDPYFYERKTKLQQTRTDIKSGKMEMLSDETYEKEIATFFTELEK